MTAGGANIPTTCGGFIPYPPEHVSLRLEERLVVRSTTESTGKIDFPVLVPHRNTVPPDAPATTVKLISSHGPIAVYVAARPGTAQLIARSRYCQRPVHGDCVAFVVIVQSRGH